MINEKNVDIFKNQVNLFNKYKLKIDENNHNRINILTILGMIINLTIFLFSMLFIKNFCSKGNYIYFLTFVVNLIVFVINNFLLKKDSHKNLILFYLYVFASLVLFSYLEIKYSANLTASAIWGIYIIYSIMLMDLPYRFILVNTIFALHLCFFSLNVKPFDIAVYDCVYAVTFYIITCISQLYLANERIYKLVLIEDITKQRDTDYLTKLNNRNTTEHLVDKYFKTRKDNINALFVIDLDNFKKANDTYGHAYGDEVLKAVAKSLKKVFRATDSISRLGGDEFVIFCPDLKDAKVAEEHANKLLKEIKAINIENHQIVGASIGIAFSKPEDNYHSLFVKADKALYKAKKNGKSCYVVSEE